MMRLSHNDGCRLAMLEISAYGGIPSQRLVGLFYDRRGNPRKVGIKGEADVQGLLPGGRAIGIEVKTGNARRTAEQKNWGRRFTELGGLYVLARWNDEHDGGAEIAKALEAAGYARIIT